MATAVKKMPSVPHTPKTYDWNELLDGQCWKLVKGEDFQCKVASFRCVAFQAATKRGMKLVTRVDGDNIYIQAIQIGANPEE